jgi:hypothetical protein
LIGAAIREIDTDDVAIFYRGAQWQTNRTKIRDRSCEIYAHSRKRRKLKVKRSGHVGIYLMNGGPLLRGHVESISRGITDRDDPAGPELLANANPTFEWVRLAQALIDRIDVGANQIDIRLRPRRLSALLDIATSAFTRGLGPRLNWERVSTPTMIEEISSQQTLRWREQDSNPRSPLRWVSVSRALFPL